MAVWSIARQRACWSEFDRNQQAVAFQQTDDCSRQPRQDAGLYADLPAEERAVLAGQTPANRRSPTDRLC